MCVWYNYMGKSQYTKAVRLLEEYDKPTIKFEDLIDLIKIKIGSDKYRTVKPVFELMLSSKLIEEIERGTFRILCGSKI